MTCYAILADLIVLVHLLLIVFVIGGELIVIAGALRRWAWVRRPVFRLAHLTVIVVVALDAVLRVICPLTRWEHWCRMRAGQSVESDVSFTGRLVRTLLYHDLPTWVFTTAYVLFALLVVATFILVPPRFSRSA